MSKPIEQFSDDELSAVIRRAENPDIPGSLHQKAKTEWDMRHQVKLVKALENSGDSKRINIQGDFVGNNKIITGGDHGSKNEFYQNDKKSWFTMDNPIIWIVASVFLSVILLFLNNLNKRAELPEKPDHKDNLITASRIESTDRGIESPTEKPNGLIRIFTFVHPPLVIVSDGVSLQKISSDGTVNWTGTTTITMEIAPTFDIYSQY